MIPAHFVGLGQGAFQKDFSNSLTRAVNEDWCRIVLSMPLRGLLRGINSVRLVRRRDKSLQWRLEFYRILLKQR